MLDYTSKRLLDEQLTKELYPIKITNVIFIIHHVLIILSKFLLFCVSVIYHVTSKNPSCETFQFFKRKKLAKKELVLDTIISDDDRLFTCLFLRSLYCVDVLHDMTVNQHRGLVLDTN